ncbi:MAG: MBL fold metallo-hydrolase [Thermaerobacter sp.]|nr:MBL fold metallo-hydrolase [Thermaerobacter sp.]
MEIRDPWFAVKPIDASTVAISEYRHWEHAHSYLLMGTERAVLIDIGLDIDHIRRITDPLTRRPMLVLTTHVHWDHIGSHGEFDTIYVHEGDANRLAHGIQGLPIERIRQDVGRDITPPIPATFDPATYRPFQGAPTVILHGGEGIDLGNRRLRILHTPGHSPDTLHPQRGQRISLPGIFSMRRQSAPSIRGRVRKTWSNRWTLPPRVPNVTRVYGAHHQLGLDAHVLDEAKGSVAFLKRKKAKPFRWTFDGKLLKV